MTDRDLMNRALMALVSLVPQTKWHETITLVSDLRDRIKEIDDDMGTGDSRDGA